jgi:hypothetical protein
MPKHATASIGDTELRMDSPPSAEEMERRQKLASLLRSRMNRPTTQEERDFWREFQADLEKDRPSFR